MASASHRLSVQNSRRITSRPPTLVPRFRAVFKVKSVVIALAIAAIAIGLWWGSKASKRTTLSADAGRFQNIAVIGGPFELTSHTGEIYNNERLAGKPYVVFFGFTHCPEICPTTLFDLTALLRELGPAADLMTAIFITVDPLRDTPELLANYMSSFDSRIIALRGDQTQTDAAVEAFAAQYRKVETRDGGFTIDHTASIFLMNSHGRFAGTLDLHELRETSLAKLKRLIMAP